jgi:hypothetical protein
MCDDVRRVALAIAEPFAARQTFHNTARGVNSTVTETSKRIKESVTGQN